MPRLSNTYNNNNNNLFNLSLFTISEANYRLTLGCDGIASSFLLTITYLLFYSTIYF
jgi:hypothetical protein